MGRYWAARRANTFVPPAPSPCPVMSAGHTNFYGLPSTASTSWAASFSPGVGWRLRVFRNGVEVSSQVVLDPALRALETAYVFSSAGDYVVTIAALYDGGECGQYTVGTITY